jgi:hypothetical protein
LKGMCELLHTSLVPRRGISAQIVATPSVVQKMTPASN